MRVENPLRWGYLTVIQRWTEPLIRKTPAGKTWFSDSHGGPKMWRLQCACGHEFDIERDKFPGKRLMRNCQRLECPYTAPEKRPEKSPLTKPKPLKGGFAYTIYIPTAVLLAVQEYAAKHNLTFAKAMIELAHKGYLQETSVDPNQQL